MTEVKNVLTVFNKDVVITIKSMDGSDLDPEYWLQKITAK